MTTTSTGSTTIIPMTPHDPPHVPPTTTSTASTELLPLPPQIHSLLDTTLFWYQNNLTGLVSTSPLSLRQLCRMVGMTASISTTVTTHPNTTTVTTTPLRHLTPDTNVLIFGLEEHNKKKSSDDENHNSPYGYPQHCLHPHGNHYGLYPYYEKSFRYGIIVSMMTIQRRPRSDP
jgi:hypothetical protein